MSRRTKQDDRWGDAEPTRHRIEVWRTNAKKLALLERGNTVVVIGRAETFAWTDKETAEKRTADGEHLNPVRETTGE